MGVTCRKHSDAQVRIYLRKSNQNQKSESLDLLADSDAPEEVVINVDSSGAWDGKPRDWPVVSVYDWVPHEVRQMSSSFYHRRPFKDFASSVCLVKVAEDASHFKLVVCQMTERVCHGRENYPTDFFYAYATMFKDLKMDPARSSTFPRLFAQRGADVRKTRGGLSRAPTTAAIPATSLPIQKAPPPPPTTEVQSPKSIRHLADKVPQSEPIPKKKGKRKAVRKSSVESIRAKRTLPNGPPLSGPLSPNSWVAKRIHFDLFAEEKALVNGMTEEEASNMAMELAARSTMCLAYAAQKRASASTELQSLQEKYDAAVKSNQDLTLCLAETERIADEDKKKANTLLAETGSAQHRMQQSFDDLKLDLQKATTSNKELMTERDGLLADRDLLRDRVLKPEANNKFLGDEVVNEHLLGFEKALALVPIHVAPPSPVAIPTIQTPVESSTTYLYCLSILGLRSSLGACPKTKVRVHERNLPHPLGLGLKSSLGAYPKIKVRVHERNLPHPFGLGLRSSLGACPKTKVRVHERNLPHPLGLGLRSSLGACPKTKVRVHERNLSHPLGLGLRSSLGACPKTKVRVHERNLPHLLGLGLRSSLGACLKTKVRVHERNLPHPLGLGLRSSLEACPKTKVRVHERNLPHPLGCYDK
ncbi:hypothetical protein LR48_Vigan04g166300 [Vigna angularis]|uniref:Uncharacterized protein n=1 Tax=Phaseolus angularis TaxID=3914 RepID=A0A0L9UF10_PHAAN|nr:hypothetical protein LR48_Vigan04g166300 [Vigna angularis]